MYYSPGNGFEAVPGSGLHINSLNLILDRLRIPPCATFLYAAYIDKNVPLWSSGSERDPY